MVDRIQLKAEVYMPLDGQWQIVRSGTVADVPDARVFAAAHATVLAETAGTLGSHGKATSVRGVRTR